MPFWPQCCESEAILSTKNVRAGVFIWENFHPGYRDLDNRASPASHINTSIFLQRKECRGEISETEPCGLPSLYEEALNATLTGAEIFSPDRRYPNHMFRQWEWRGGHVRELCVNTIICVEPPCFHLNIV